MMLNSLNTEFAIPGQIFFFEGKGDFPFIKIENQYASAVISLYGGQVLSFKTQSTDEHELLFVSDKAYYQEGKAIKGGIPICWPWFGKDPEELGRSSHGFARNLIWSVKETTTTSNGETQVSLGLVDTEETQKIWPYAFNLTLIITVGKTLKLELNTRNTGEESFVITQALHTYFSVVDISKVRINGLDNVEYIDTTLNDWPIVKQDGDITFNQEVDRIYTNSPSKVSLIDHKKNHRINISSTGSNSTVVWNPWEKIAKDMGDLKDNAYQYFVCIETTNAASDLVNILPGEDYSITAEYEIAKV